MKKLPIVIIAFFIVLLVATFANFQTLVKAASPTLDSYAASTADATSNTLSITTTGSSDIIYAEAYIQATGYSFSISSNAGLNWNVRESLTTPVGMMEVWYAISTAPINGKTITITTTYSTSPEHLGILYVAFSGVNTASPFDPSYTSAPPTPVYGTSTGANIPLSFSVTDNKDVVVGIIVGQDFSSTNPTTVTNYGLIEYDHGNADGLADEYNSVSLSSGSVSPGFTVPSGDNYILFADAIAPQPTTLGSLTITGYPTSTVAGTNFGSNSITVKAYDTNNNLMTDYTGSVYFTSTDTYPATLPYTSTSKYTFTTGAGDDNGAHTFPGTGFTLYTTSSQTITVTDSATSISATTTAITVSAAGAASFVVSGFPNPTVAGVSHTVTVTAKDAYNNTATGYAGTVKITSSDGKAVLPANAGLTSGVGTFSITLETAGSQSITATDTVTSSITGSQTGIIVDAAASKLVFTAGAGQSLTAGVVSPTAIVVERQDSFGNPVSTGASAITVTLSTSSSVGAFYSNSGGTTVITSIAIAAGSSDSVGYYYKDTVADSPTLTGASSGLTSATTTFTINAAGVSKFAFNTIGTQTVGTAFSITIAAEDASGNIVTTYTGNPTLTYSAGTISPTSSGSFVSGTKTVSVTVTTSGTGVTITATDGSTTGTSNSFTVNAAGVASFVVSGFPNPTVAGVSHTVTVTAKDAYNNTVTSYAGIVNIASSDSEAVLPANAGLTSGVGSFTVTLKTAGSQSITATDTVTSSITGSQNGITVSAAGAVSFVVSGFPNPTVAGVSHTVTVTAKDAYNNTATGYAGKVKITSSDSKAVLPANAGLTSGVGSFTVTLKTAGSQSITATDTVTSSITGSQTGITVNAASGDYFVVSGFPSPTVAGVAHTFTVTVYDAAGNVATGYAGTVAITSSDGKAVLPPSAGLTNGVGSFIVTLETAGSQSITATDTVTSSITGFQNGITVSAAGAVSFVVSGFPSPTVAGVAHSVTVTSKDVYNNTVTSYTGKAKITSSDSKAVLPANAGLTSGVGSFTVTLETAGSQSITATDTVTSSITGSQTGITVNASLSVTVSPSSWIMDIGQNNTFSATAGGGSGSYKSYLWYVGGSTQPGATASTFSFVPGSSGSYLITVMVNDSSGASAQSSAANVTVSASPTVSITPVGPISLDAGQTQTFTATASGGSGVVHYQWYEDVTAVGTDSASYSYTAAGHSHVITCVVTDSASTPVTSPASNAVDITVNSATSSPTPPPTSTPTSTPTPTPEPTTTPAATPSPTPTPSVTIVPATTSSGATVDLTLNGNITSSQISDGIITSYQPSKTTTVSFVIKGPNGTAGFGNMTIPKTAIYYGTSPTVYIDGQQAPNQGYTQDANNFYVWFTTSFSAHQVSIQFVVSSTSPASLFGPVFAVGITVPEIISIFTVIAVRRLRRGPENA